MAAPSVRVVRVAAPIVLLGVLGCSSLSDSSESISRSVNDALESVSHSLEGCSDSSSGTAHAEASQNFQRDVYCFTVAWRDEQAPDEELVRGVSRIAELYGRTDWESDPAALTAIASALGVDAPP
jgi:hypothetical protein